MAGEKIRSTLGQLEFNVADHVQAVNISAVAPDSGEALAVNGRESIAALALQVLPVLQTTLDVSQLLNLFHCAVKQTIQHDGLHYRHVRQNTEITIGTIGAHTCTYRLIIKDAALGEITYSRDLPFSVPELARLEYLLSILVYPLRNCLSYKTALELARKDPLTGVYNRGVMEAVLAREVGLARRYRAPFSLIFMDLDNFKFINDSLGHSVGDGVICEFARCIEASFRTTDILARYGGDEFVALLSNTPEAGAQLLATRICETVARSERLAALTRGHRVTTSAGVATLAEKEAAESLIDRADRALNAAKQDGRNCVRSLSFTMG